jgi:predicted O-methyltransferase YrrM
VSDHVTVTRADGLDALEATADGSIDLAVLDAERPAYVAYWPQLVRVLTPGGVIAVDNAVSHRDQVTSFRDLATSDGHFAVHLHEIGDGVLTAVRLPPGE